jgi:hypothetical protein
MATFLLTYRTPGGSDGIEAWKAWFEELGDAVVDRGNPVFTATTFGECGSAPALGGYSLITADNLEAAAVLAKGCPVLARGGGVEIGEITVIF